MKGFLLLCFISINFIFADSITLYNDSIFELIAIVRAANGKTAAQKTLAPGEQSIWTTDQISTQLKTEYDSSGSYTPFTVIWQCSYEGIFSVCYNVASGATVVATNCSGSHYCKPKSKNNKKTSCNNCIKYKN